MKKIYYIFIFLSYLACDSNTKDEKKKDMSITYSEIVWKDYNEVLNLLAYKYEIDSSKVKPLILEYLRIHEPAKYYSLTMKELDRDTTVLDNILKPKETINTTVERLTHLYSIDGSIISSFIYDFRVYYKLLEIENDCNN